MRPTGAVMVCGSASGVGKSTVATALCRAWSRRGVTVAPFKAWNMSNHSAVTVDGGEVGRAQAVQAQAAGVALERRMNPMLVKPSARWGSHVVVMGDEIARDGSVEGLRSEGRGIVLEALASLRRDHPLVVVEGAGGAAEINLLDRDIVNLPLARAAGIPAVLVVDIDRGGAFAAAYGTMALLPDDLRDRVRGIVFNGFRGEEAVLAAGVTELEQRTGVPVLGVLPHLGPRTLLGLEDSLDIEGGYVPGAGAPQDEPSADPVLITALRLPHLANPSDLDPFLVEPDVELRWVTRPSDLAGADLIVVPGSRATVDDLDWLRARGLDRALTATDALIVGICGGYQMLGGRIEDDIESGRGAVRGLGLLGVDTTFAAPKTVGRVSGSAAGDPISGYQIRWGRPEVHGVSWLDVGGVPEGCLSDDGRVRGTSVHGVFDADGFRSRLLAEVAAGRGRRYRPAQRGFEECLNGQHEALADWVESAIDMESLGSIVASAVTPGHEPGWE